MGIAKKRAAVYLAAVWVFVLFLQGTSLPATAVAKSTAYMQEDAEWRYWDEGTDPCAGEQRATWAQPDFDDSNWKVNTGLEPKFGEKNGAPHAGSQVLLQKGKAAYFFRTDIVVESVHPDYGLEISVKYGDGAVVYINGERAIAYQEPEGGFASNTAFGGKDISGAVQETFKTDCSLLKKGRNVIAVEIHRASEENDDVYFEMPVFTVSEQKIRQKTVSLLVGEDESKRNVTWHVNMSTPAQVQYAEKEGDLFPSAYKTAEATVSKSLNDTGFYVNSAVLEELKPDTEYVYRLVNGRFVSDVYSFKTDAEGDFSFLFTGDPQIQSANAMMLWGQSLENMHRQFPNSNLLISAGDQVDTADNENQYEWYLTPYLMQQLTQAPTIGNHDTSSVAFGEHFTLPNERFHNKYYGYTKAGADYWYVYNDVLFMHLNTNASNTDEHYTFMQKAVAENKDVTWKIVVFHHTLFSLEEGRWNNTEQTILRRNALMPWFDSLGIDLALMGHDHTYVRTHVLDKKANIVEKGTSFYKPEGIIYVAGGSGSGSKYYDIYPGADTSLAAFYWQGYEATMANVEVTKDFLRMTTYKVGDMSVLDSFEIVKGAVKPTTTTTTMEETTTTAEETTTTAEETTTKTKRTVTVILTTRSTTRTTTAEETTTTAEETTTTAEETTVKTTDFTATLEESVTGTTTLPLDDSNEQSRRGNVGWIIAIVAGVALTGGAVTFIVLSNRK